LSLFITLEGPEGSGKSTQAKLLARRRHREKRELRKEGRFEIEALAFHERVRRGYLELARREPGRFVLVPVEGSPGQVHEAVWARLVETCDLKRRKRRT
jgi:thymidylate kinase